MRKFRFRSFLDDGLFVVLIMVAALVVTRRRRRSNGRPPAPADARGWAGWPGDAPREIAIVPGFSDTVQPDRGVPRSCSVRL